MQYSTRVYFCIQVVPLDLKSDEQELKAFNVRMDDLYAIDLTFLQGFDQPTLAYLAEVRLYALKIIPNEYLINDIYDRTFF